jgi:hypothetical protein
MPTKVGIAAALIIRLLEASVSVARSRIEDT